MDQLKVIFGRGNINITLEITKCNVEKENVKEEADYTLPRAGRSPILEAPEADHGNRTTDLEVKIKLESDDKAQRDQRNATDDMKELLSRLQDLHLDEWGAGQGGHMKTFGGKSYSSEVVDWRMNTGRDADMRKGRKRNYFHSQYDEPPHKKIRYDEIIE